MNKPSNARPSRRLVSLSVAAALLPAVLTGCNVSRAEAPATAAVAQAPVATHALPDFSSLIANVGNAVVNVSTVQKQAQNQAFGGDDSMQEFLRRFYGPGFQMPNQGPVHGIGSGFIVSPDGYILTNAHVVTNASEVTVKLTDRREFTAKVVGKDDRTDVALLKIDASGLPTVRIGDPKSVKVGQWVIAVGSPFGFDNSATAGIVSATSRSIPGDTYAPFIQSDVAVNPGNSGGPLFDVNGNVIGINSQIYSRTGGYMGVSFAIPIDVAMNVEQQLQQYGKVSHGRIGVAVQPVNQALAQSFGLKQPRGALVSSVDQDGPAAKAGIRSGDIILSFDGHKIDESTDLPRLVGDMKPGKNASVEVWRNGGTHDLNVTLGAMQPEKVAANDASGAEGGKLGLAVRPLTREEQSEAHAKGLLVENVTGAAERAGVQPGDVVLAVDGQPVASAEQMRQLVDKHGKHVALLIQRDQAQMYVPVEIAG
jgi:serine protease Do